YLIFSAILVSVLAPQRVIRIWLQNTHPSSLQTLWYRSLDGIWQLSSVISLIWTLLFGGNLVQSKCRDDNPSTYWVVVFEVLFRIFYYIVLAAVSLYIRVQYPTVRTPNPLTTRTLPNNGGLSPEELKALPTFEFTARMYELQQQTASRIRESPDSAKSLRRNSILMTTIKRASVSSLSDVQFSSGFSCAICVSDYEVGEVLRKLICSHVFHQSCIDLWFTGNVEKGTLGHKTCPLCNSIQKPDSEVQPEPSVEAVNAINIDTQ
ncbi:E3 ubiquitin-protein ligase rnf38, partial [Nowakowskiella sp. JEL0078]